MSIDRKYEQCRRCLICEAPVHFSFSRDFPEFGLKRVDYVKCKRCGFLFAETLAALVEARWAHINQQFHSCYQGKTEDPNDPRWQARLNAQARVVADLADSHLLASERPWVDYGCGDGKLSTLLAEIYSLRLGKYEKYMVQGKGYMQAEDMKSGGFDFVVSTSVFEHLRSRAELDEIAMLVADNGAMGIHTLVTEEVPCDPKWFYFLPVHCSFFTNRSMQVLFEDWGYKASVYNVESRLWVWFKGDADMVERVIKAKNARTLEVQPIYYFKRGFMDYWKKSTATVMNREQGVE